MKGLRVASVPVGVGVGLWTAQLTTVRCPPTALCLFIPYFTRLTFATWQCALFGAGAAVVVLLLSWARRVTNVLLVASVPVGVAIGLWTAQQLSIRPTQCPLGLRCVALRTVEPTFVAWQCVLVGVGAAVVVLLLSFALAVVRVHRSGGKKPVMP